MYSIYPATSNDKKKLIVVFCFPFIVERPDRVSKGKVDADGMSIIFCLVWWSETGLC